MSNEPQWQPIETAPKDGTEILVFRMCCGCTPIAHVAFYKSKEEWDEIGYIIGDTEEEFVGWWSYVRHSITQEKLDGDYTPTHWIPIPKLPKQ